MPRRRTLIASLALLLLGTAHSLAAPPKQVELRGRVADADGQGIAGVAVRLIQGRRDFQMLEWKYEDEIRDDVVARTDEHGFFEATLQPDPDYRFYWLRFFEGESFDGVRYERPADVTVTETIRSGRPVIQTMVVQDNPAWPEVQEWIARFGAGSPRAHVVRRMGIPDRRETTGGVESFWYESEGVVYRFRDGEFVGEERLEGDRAATRADS